MDAIIGLWELQKGREQAQEGQRTDIEWDQYTFPPLFPVVHIDSDDLKKPEEKTFLYMNYVSFFLTFIYYCVVGVCQVYIFGKHPEEIVGICIALLHVIFGLGLSFFILFRAFYGVALGGPCYLIYKVTEGVFIFFSFYCLLKSKIGINGISFAFIEANKSPSERDMTMIYFASAEILLGIMFVGVRTMNLIDCQLNLDKQFFCLENIKVYYKDLPQLLENSYQECYPQVLGNIKMLFIQYQNLVQEIQQEFFVLLSQEQKLTDESKFILKKCLNYFNQFNDKYTVFFSLEKMKNFLEIKQSLQYFQINFHSLFHMDNQKNGKFNTNLKKIQTMINDLEKIPNFLKAEVDQNILILTYFQQRQAEILKYVKKYSKEHQILEKIENNESYYQTFYKLCQKNDQEQNNKEFQDKFKILIKQLKQRTQILQKIEFILEHPKHLAFQLRNFGEEKKDENAPQNFEQFLQNFNNENFIMEKLIKMGLKEIIELIRYLYKISSEEDQQYQFPISYNEEIFLDLISRLKQNEINLQSFMNTNYEEIIKEYQLQKNQDFIFYNHIGEKLMGQIFKVLRYKQFNQSFLRFQE